MFEFLQYTFVFLSLFVMLAGVLSFYAQSFSVVVLNSWLMFLAVTTETGYDFFETLTIVITIGMAMYSCFKIWTDFLGSSSGGMQ